MFEVTWARAPGLRKAYNKSKQKFDFNPTETDYRYDVQAYRDLREFSAALDKAKADPECSLVLGRPLVESGPRDKQHFSDRQTRLFGLDVDDVYQEDLSDDAVLKTIIDRYPILAGKQLVIEKTSSFGLHGEMSVRVWFQTLTEYSHEDQLSLVYDHAWGLDASVYQPARLMLTATAMDLPPECRVNRRVLFIDGEEYVDLKFKVKRKRITVYEANFNKSSDKPTWSGEGTLGGQQGNARSLPALKMLSQAWRYCGLDADEEEMIEVYLEALRDAPGYRAADEIGGKAKAYGYEWAKYRVQGAKAYAVPRREKSVLAIANEVSTIPKAEAKKKAQDVIHDFFNRKPTHLLEDEGHKPFVVGLRTYPGLGKTYDAVKAAVDLVGTNWPDGVSVGTMTYISMYTTTHEKAEEIVDLIRKLDPSISVMLWRGREQDGMCAEYDTMQRFQRVFPGQAQQAMCYRKLEGGEKSYCQHWDQCSADGYQSQFARRETVNICVSVDTTSRTNLSTKNGNRGGREDHFVIFDEATGFTTRAQSDPKLLKMKAFGQMVGALRGRPRATGCRVAKWIARKGTPEQLRDEFTDEDLKELGKALEKAADNHLPFLPEDDAEHKNKILDDIESERIIILPNLRWATDRLRHLREDLSPNAIEFIGEDVGFYWFREMPAVHEKANLLLMGAQLPEQAVRHVYPEVEFHEIRHDLHEGSEIIMSDYSGTQKRLVDENAVVVPDILKTMIRKGWKAFGPKKMFEQHKFADEFEEGTDYNWFNNLIGLNLYEDSNAIVAGYNRQDPATCEAIARCIYYDSDEIISLHGANFKNRYVQTCNLDHATLQPYHPDDRVEEIRYEMMEGEQLQALGRARPWSHERTCVALTTTTLKIPGIKFVERWDPVVTDRERILASYKDAVSYLGYTGTQQAWSARVKNFKGHYHHVRGEDGRKYYVKEVQASDTILREPQLQVDRSESLAMIEAVHRSGVEDLAMVLNCGDDSILVHLESAFGPAFVNAARDDGQIIGDLYHNDDLDCIVRDSEDQQIRQWCDIIRDNQDLIVNRRTF